MKLEREISYKYSATDATGAATRSAEQNIQRLGGLAKTYAPIIAGAFSVAGLAKATDLFVRQEQSVFQLEQRLKSTGGVVGYNSQQLQGMAASLQGLTTYGDEATIEMQALLLTFTNIRGTIFEQTLPAILDMSTAMNQDLKSSAIQVGKALNNPIEGISALTRVGVTFTDAQKEQIRTLQESGRMAEAQAIILRELKTEFGGAAEAARKGLGGSLKALSNSFGDALETIGSGGTGFIGSIRELEAVITSKDFQAGLAAIAEGIGWIGTVTARVTAQIGVAAEMWSNDDAAARVRQIVDRQAKLWGEMANMPEGGITGALLSIRRGQIKDELAALAEEYQTLVKLAAFNTKPEQKTGGGKGKGNGTVDPRDIVKMDRKEWDAILSQQELDDAAAAIGNFQAQLRVRLAEAPPLSLLGNFDISSHTAGRDDEAGIAAAAERYASLEQSLMSETELIQSNHWDRMRIADEARQLGLISETEHNATRLQLTMEHENAITAARKNAELERYYASTETDRLRLQAAGATANHLGTLFEASDRLFKGKHKALFIATRAAAAAGAIINGYQAGMAAVAPPPIGFGPVIGAAIMPIMIAGGITSAASIMAQTFEGGGRSGGGGGVTFGGGTGGYGGGTPNSPIFTQPTSQQQGPQEITIKFVGAVTEAWFEEVAVPGLNNAYSRNIKFEFVKG